MRDGVVVQRKECSSIFGQVCLQELPGQAWPAEAREARCRRLRLLGSDLLQPDGNQLIRYHFGVQILARSVKVNRLYLEFNRQSCRYASFSTLLPH